METRTQMAAAVRISTTPPGPGRDRALMRGARTSQMARARTMTAAAP